VSPIPATGPSSRIGPATIVSVIVTSVPPLPGVRTNSTRASPAGQIRARSCSRCGGLISSTSVKSQISSGQDPTAWWIRLPTSGHPGSTARMCAAPTIHEA